jgi:hypothetical protein
LIYTLVLFLIAGALFVAILGMLELGRRIGARRLAQDPAGARAGIGAVDGAVFGLLGLLIAFTFSGAAARFEARRNLVTEEANAIGTAWLRIDVLPAEAQPALRDLFRRYLDSRIAAYRKVPDMDAALEELGRSVALQGEIWTAAVAAGQAAPAPAATMLLLPALNQMIDITTTRLVATQSHPPFVIFGMLMLLAMAGGLLAGYGMGESKGRNWLHIAGFALTMALAVYVILDLEYPRLGLIRIDSADQVLVDLRQTFD